MTTTPDLAAARSGVGSAAEVARLHAAYSEPDFARYEVLKDIVDECIDLSLNYRQSGHPGGSRSKVHLLLSLLLSGAMRWDIRRPWLRFADRSCYRRAHGAARLLHPRRAQRGPAGAARAAAATLASPFPPAGATP